MVDVLMVHTGVQRSIKTSLDRENGFWGGGSGATGSIYSATEQESKTFRFALNEV